MIKVIHPLHSYKRSLNGVTLTKILVRGSMKQFSSLIAEPSLKGGTDWYFFLRWSMKKISCIWFFFLNFGDIFLFFTLFYALWAYFKAYNTQYVSHNSDNTKLYSKSSKFTEIFISRPAQNSCEASMNFHLLKVWHSQNFSSEVVWLFISYRCISFSCVGGVFVHVSFFNDD